MVKHPKLDTTDVKILNELQLDAKLPLREIAKRAGTSFVTVLNRIRRMEQAKMIQGYSPRLDYELLGYDVHVMIEMRIARGKLFELEKKIARSQNVLAVYDTTGDYDAVILARFKSTRTMDEFLKQIQGYDFVERTNTKLILNTIKEGSLRL